MSDTCMTCVKYEPTEGKYPTSGTGWCNQPKLSQKRQRTHKDNWCNNYERNQSKKQDHSEDVTIDTSGELSKPGDTRPVYSSRIGMAVDRIKNLLWR